jgi:predicted dienelactone hydrolase
LWPGWGDPRIDAIVSMAGDAYFFGEAGLAEITIPVMALGGTADTGTPYLWGTHPTYEHVSSPTKARVAFEDAEHMIFGATCEALPWFTEIGFDAYCSDPVWDMEHAHDLAQHFITAFLLTELTQDADAAIALAPDSVQFPGVVYDAQGF